MAEGEAIECVVAPWYYRRLGLIILVLAGCGCWFLYDGMVGWPKSNHGADLYDAFHGARNGKNWADLERENGWSESDPGNDPGTAESLAESLAELRAAFEAGAGEQSWREYTAARRMSEHKPKRYLQEKIEGQFHWAYGAFLLAAGTAVVLLINAPKKLRADSEGFFPPAGGRVPLAGVFKVDKRKWDNKGLAYVYYREGDGPSRKAVIDDLKFAGAGKILDRLLANFEGDVVDRLPIPEDDEDTLGDDDLEEVEEAGEEAPGAEDSKDSKE